MAWTVGSIYQPVKPLTLLGGDKHFCMEGKDMMVQVSTLWRTKMANGRA